MGRRSAKRPEPPSRCILAPHDCCAGKAPPSAASILLPLLGGVFLEVILPLLKRGAAPRHSPPQDETTQYPRPAWLPPGVLSWFVCGEAGTGKSSLINFFRGVKPGDDGAAPVGITETTGMDRAAGASGPNWYHAPGAPQVRMYDLPGAGTVKFPAGRYLVDMGLRHANGVLLVVGNRVKEIDNEIIKLLVEHRVPFFVIRSKLDLDVQDNLYDKGIDKEETLNIVRTDTQQQLAKAGCPSSNVYAVTTRGNDCGDYAKLVSDVATSLQRQYTD